MQGRGLFAPARAKKVPDPVLALLGAIAVHELAVAEQSSASSEQMSAGTQETSTSTQQIELTRTAEELDDLVQRFRLTA